MAVNYRPVRFGGCLEVEIQAGEDGARLLRSTEALQPHPHRQTDRLKHWARVFPDRCFVACRDAQGAWQRVTYAQMLERVQRVGQSLLDRGLSQERPLMILSDNDIEHLVMALGAAWVGIPHAPISTAYSLVAQDHAKLRHAIRTLTPGMVFANGPAYERAIDAVVPADVEVVLSHGSLSSREVTPFNALQDVVATGTAMLTNAAIRADTIVKFLFTSGSTKQPKAVINTHGMLTANQQMLLQVLPFLAEEPPVLVDWLPWSHTFGGNQNVGLVLYNGGTLYIDHGKPTPQGISQTIRNLHEISPTIYFNVPKGYEALTDAMEHDDVLRQSLFRDVKAFMYAGAGLAQDVWDRMDHHAERTLGERVQIITGLGMTETAPSCTFAVRTDLQSGWIGLPVPGVDVKLAPVDDRTEIRFRGPNVTPGYWREPELSAQAFDTEGFYCTGDAVRLVQSDKPQLGLYFEGRIAEDFKLSTGTFVSVGALRAKVVARGAPWVQDAVVTGLNRDDIGVLLVPNVAACRRLAALGADAQVPEVLTHPAVRQALQGLLEVLWVDGTGSATRVARALLLAAPPSLENGEMTDKGSINQRAVLARRADLVEALYAGTDPRVQVARGANPRQKGDGA